MPDIVQSRGGKKRVAYGMRKHVAVAVRDQSGFGGDFHSAEQNIILFFAESVRVHADSRTRKRRPKIFGIGEFHVGFVAVAKFRRADICRVHGRIVGEIAFSVAVSRFVCRRKFVAVKSLRRLNPIGARTIGVGKDTPAFVRRGKRIRGGNGTNAAFVSPHGFYAARDRFRRNERSRAVVNEHDIARRFFQRVIYG